MNLRSPGATKLVGTLMLVLVAAAGWVLGVGPKTSELSDVRLEIAAAREQNDVLRQQLATLDEQREQLGALRADAQALATKFPPTADQPGLFEQVSQAALDAGIRPEDVTSVAPTPPSVGGTQTPVEGQPVPESAGGVPLARQTVTVAVQGSYDQTQRLLDNLEHLPRAYLITSLTLTGGGTEGTYTTTVAGDMFVMAPIPDPAETVGAALLTGG